MFETDELLMQDIYNYLSKRPFCEVCLLMSRLNTFVNLHIEKQKQEQEEKKEEKKDADNTGS